MRCFNNCLLTALVTFHNVIDHEVNVSLSSFTEVCSYSN